MVFVLLITQSCRQSPAERPVDKVYLRYTIVKEGEVWNRVRAAGRLSSKVESKLSFKTGGVIEKIFVGDGESVAKDQILGRLALSEIESRFRQAELALNKSRRDFQRAKNLYRDSVVTLEQLQNATTAMDLAESNLEIARFNMKYSSIRAPSKGKILKKLAETNEIVAPGQPVFLFASTESEWVLRANITDRDIVQLNLDDSAMVQFDAFPRIDFPAYVSELGEMADPYTGTFEVELKLSKYPDKLINGLIGTTHIYPENSTIIPLIPHEALLSADGMEGWVYVLVNGTPVKRKVSIQAILDEGLSIRSGIAKGDTLIVEGGPYIRDNCELILTDEVSENH